MTIGSVRFSPFHDITRPNAARSCALRSFPSSASDSVHGQRALAHEPASVVDRVSRIVSRSDHASS